jgi:hypothetical protein
MSFNKINTILFLALVSIICECFLCNKSLDCREVSYNFDMGIKAYPDKDSIYIGDTLWLEVNETTILTDAQTGRAIDYSQASNLGTAIGIAELLSVNNLNVEGNSFFKFFVSIGREISRPDTNRFREYNFSEVNNKYQFKLGVIPQKQGIYKMFVSNASNIYRKNDNCTKANFGINFTATNQHLYFNEIVLPGVTLPAGGGIYLFKVK